MSDKFDEKTMAMPELKVHITGWTYDENNERQKVDVTFEGRSVFAFVTDDKGVRGAAMGVSSGRDHAHVIRALIDQIGRKHYRIAHALANAMIDAEERKDGRAEGLGQLVADMLQGAIEKAAAAEAEAERRARGDCAGADNEAGASAEGC